MGILLLGNHYRSRGKEQTMEKIYRVKLNSKGMPNFSTAVEVADRPQGEWKGYEIPSECSVCGHHWDEYVFGQELWHDGSVPNYCPNCGAKMKGADDD